MRVRVCVFVLLHWARLFNELVLTSKWIRIPRLWRQRTRRRRQLRSRTQWSRARARARAMQLDNEIRYLIFKIVHSKCYCGSRDRATLIKMKLMIFSSAVGWMDDVFGVQCPLNVSRKRIQTAHGIAQIQKINIIIFDWRRRENCSGPNRMGILYVFNMYWPIRYSWYARHCRSLRVLRSKQMPINVE